MRETIIEILDRYGEIYNPTDSDSILVSILRNSAGVNWGYVSIYQKLPEDFIREFQDNVGWACTSLYQKLSEDFIREFQDRVNWDSISQYQKLSEDFIREFQDKVDWVFISGYQKLSEDFIREFQDNVGWACTSLCQKLSEGFIREFKNKIYWGLVSECQKLSDSFLKEFNLTKPNLSENWLYASDSYKVDYIKNNTQYEVIDDKYVIAYISEVFGYDVEGETYEKHCSYAQNPPWNSTLTAYTKNYAKDNFPTPKKVRIQIEDVGVVDNNGKIHCSRWTVLSKNSTIVKETCPRCSNQLTEKISQGFLGSSTYIVKKCPNCGYCG